MCVCVCVYMYMCVCLSSAYYLMFSVREGEYWMTVVFYKHVDPFETTAKSQCPPTPNNWKSLGDVLVHEEGSVILRNTDVWQSFYKKT